MTNDLRMLRRCLIGCHLRRVGRRKAKSGLDPRGGKRGGGGREKGRMMMRAKLIILGGCKRLRTFSFSSFSFLSFFLPFLPPSCPPLFAFPRCSLNFDDGRIRGLVTYFVKRKNHCRRGTGPAKRWHNDEVNLMFPEFLWFLGIRFFVASCRFLFAIFVGFDLVRSWTIILKFLSTIVVI